MTLAKGALPDCTLLTAILTDQPGFPKCILSAPVMSITYNIGTQGTLSQLSNTDGTTQSIVEEMLKQGSQVRPSLYKNQGEVIKIFVARDVDFSTVYELRPIVGTN